MRYTIIHHDVREYFELTPIQYMVCDSIHQLSHGAPTKKQNTKIAEFIGVDEWSVRDAKKKLQEKGLIEEIDGGWTSTEKWNHVVTYLPNRGNPEANRGNPESHNIYIKNNKTAEAKASDSPILVVEEEPKKERKPKDTRALILREKLYTMFENSTGVRPTTTTADYVRVTEALKHLEEKHIEDMVENALSYGGEKTVREVLTARKIDIYRQENL